MEKDVVDEIKRKFGMGIFFLLVIILAYGWRLGSGREVHSDETCNVFVGLDLFHGNLFLKDWNFSTGLFMLPTIELSLLTEIFGFNDTVIYITAAANYALMIMASLYVVKKMADSKLKNTFTFVLATIFILLVPRADTLLNAGTHVLSYSVAIMALYYIYHLSYRAHKIMETALGILLGLLAVANSMFLYTVCVPVILTGILESYENRKVKKLSRLVMYGAISIVSWLLLRALWEVIRGEALGGINTVFTTRDNIWDNIVIGICNILELYGINFWGENVISLSTCKAVIGFFLFAKLVYEIYKFLRNPKERDKVLVYLFLFMALVNGGAYIFSTVPAYSTDTNTLQPFLIGFTICGMLAWIHNINMNVSTEDGRTILGVTMVFFLLMMPTFTLKQPDNTDRQEVAEYLVENGYEKGYGAYWEATSVMYESGGKITICPVICHAIVELVDDVNIVAYKFMSNTEWQQQEGNFLIVDSDSYMQFGINEERIITTFGQWSDVKKFGDITLYLWDENIQLVDY